MKTFFSILQNPFAGLYAALGLAFLIFFIVVSLGGCVDEKDADRILRVNNYTPIETGGYGWFDGDKGDVYKTRFKAVAPNGDTVSGTVTKGWFKGSRILLD